MENDYQRRKVYNWERVIHRYNGLNNSQSQDTSKIVSKEEAKKYVTLIWNIYKNQLYHNFRPQYAYCSEVRIDNHKGRRRACMYNGFYNITDGKRILRKRKTKDGRYMFYKKMCLPSHSRDKQSMIHEISHALAPNACRHGIDFVNIYVYLMVKELKYKLSPIIKALNKHGIKFDFKKSKRIYNYLNKVNREEVK